MAREHPSPWAWRPECVQLSEGVYRALCGKRLAQIIKHPQLPGSTRDEWQCPFHNSDRMLDTKNNGQTLLPGPQNLALDRFRPTGLNLS